MAPTVAISVFYSNCTSGIRSSTTTNTMAPATRTSAQGGIGRIRMTAAAPITPATGSTMPDNCPYQELLTRETPSLRNGTETATPSGRSGYRRPAPEPLRRPASRTADWRPTPQKQPPWPSLQVCCARLLPTPRGYLNANSFSPLWLLPFGILVDRWSDLLGQPLIPNSPMDQPQFTNLRQSLCCSPTVRGDCTRPAREACRVCQPSTIS